MGIGIVHKSGPNRKSKDVKKALVLAGGAVVGGSFNAGGLKALNDYFSNFSVNDFDIYVGISSGSILASALAGRISPESIVKSLNGTSGSFSPLTGWHYYRPNIAELILRPMRYITKMAVFLPGSLLRLAAGYPEWSKGFLKNILGFLEHPTLVSYEDIMRSISNNMGGNMPSFAEILPSGVFENSAIEAYVRKNIEHNGLINDFQAVERETGKKIYITAVRLNSGNYVLFGPDEDSSVSISQAIQASTALPGFYKPARINGIDYVDGGIHRTASLDVAVSKGAKLIVCYNPFRPYDPDKFVRGIKRDGRKKEGGIASGGLLAVFNQIFRSLFHSRLEIAIDHYRNDSSFDGDIILIEPSADDEDFFELNPMLFRNRLRAAMLGFRSVANSVDEKFDELLHIFGLYGMDMSRVGISGEIGILSGKDVDEDAIRKVLECRLRKNVEVYSKSGAKFSRTVKRIKKVRGKVKRYEKKQKK